MGAEEIYTPPPKPCPALILADADPAPWAAVRREPATPAEPAPMAKIEIKFYDHAPICRRNHAIPPRQCEGRLATEVRGAASGGAPIYGSRLWIANLQ
jgi:hypothetical protein